jgi:hypothetical protein
MLTGSLLKPSDGLCRAQRYHSREESQAPEIWLEPARDGRPSERQRSPWLQGDNPVAPQVSFCTFLIRWEAVLCYKANGSEDERAEGCREPPTRSGRFGRWVMIRQLALLAGIVMTAAACAAVDMAGPPTPVDTFAHRAANSELVLRWNCLQPAAGTLRVEGVAHNPWQAQPIGYLELQVVGVDAEGRQTGEAAGKARDVQILTSQRSPFQLDLKTTGTEVRVDLYYPYVFNQEWESGALLVAGPPMAAPRQYAQSTNTNMVRDACSPTQHLAR